MSLVVILEQLGNKGIAPTVTDAPQLVDPDSHGCTDCGKTSGTSA
jgi:hypothetical protein